jgi:protein-ribulosamine 3-kinase
MAMTKYFSVGGGSINQACCIEDEINQHKYFVKVNIADLLFMFEAEQLSLNEIHKTKTILVPSPLCSGIWESHSYLVLSWVDFEQQNKASSLLLGEQLASLHQVTHTQFGWHDNNTIGSTLQQNDWCDSWVDFYIKRRIKFQLELAEQQGYNGRLQKLGKQLMDKIPQFFIDYQPKPSLLHGDLWGGNCSSTIDQEPIVFDPACYYGDREADIAMTELFGGFTADFYQSYHQKYPLDSGYAKRKVLYNLYHVLNHLNLFGSGYLGQAEQMITKLL